MLKTTNKDESCSSVYLVLKSYPTREALADDRRKLEDLCRGSATISTVYFYEVWAGDRVGLAVTEYPLVHIDDGS